jgi:hypothetical protein
MGSLGELRVAHGDGLGGRREGSHDRCGEQL